MRIIVTGLVGQYAFGGVAWDYLQFVEGFRQLGHDAYYLEDTETWPYDPLQNTVTGDCRYNVQYLGDVMKRLGLEGRWAYRNAPDTTYHGLTESEVKKLCAHADLYVNVSGCGWMRPEYAAIPHRVFLDTDPMFTQVRFPPEMILAHNHLFTFAENIGRPECRVPTLGLKWHTTRQPIVLDWWMPSTELPREQFTTVMNWVSYKGCEHAGETWGQKDVEFLKFVDLPCRTSQKFEIACGKGPGAKRPTDRLRSQGWAIVEPEEKLPDPWAYRDYLRASRGEWSVAKEGYVKSHSGWFSCRSACYLALGRPCVLQDTGWSQYYPTGRGLWAFATREEALDGIEAVNADYVRHCEAARRIAEQSFDARKVLGAMLERIS